MITAEINVHEEPVYQTTTYHGGGYQVGSCKQRPATKEEALKDIAEELTLYQAKDLQIGDRIYTKAGLCIEVLAFKTQDGEMPSTQVNWYAGYPGCIKARTWNTPTSTGCHYSSGEIDWSRHEKLATLRNFWEPLDEPTTETDPD